jgi:membrane associated rhomboid family serine protease
MIPLGDSTRLRKPSKITPLLILSNILVYLYIIFIGSTFSFFASRWGLVPARIQQGIHLLPVVSPIFWTFITSLFLHGGLWHLLSNMLFLWVFGDNIEDRFGRIPFLLFYLAGGVIASLSQYFQNPGSMVPMIGASGAISAVMGAYIYLYPGASVQTLIPIFFIPLVFNVPAIFFLLFWFFNQIISASFGSPGVGWMAHIGGFLFGLFIAMIFISKDRNPGAREIIYPS